MSRRPQHLVDPERGVAAAETLRHTSATCKESELFMDWRNRAACLDEDPELFFPVGTTGPALEQVERAKAVCGACTVIEQCLEWALDSNQDAGVWGGMSEDERRTLRRSRQRRRRMAS